MFSSLASRSMTRSFSFLFAAATTAVLSLHCGGRVDGESPTPTQCPTNLNQACPANATCTTRVNDCNGARDVTCTCDGTGWTCPQTAGCPNPCTNVVPGGACAAEGALCKTPSPPNCDVPMDGQCTCAKGKWMCSVTICEDPPPPLPVCPPPGAIKEGAFCSGNATCAGLLQCPKGTADVNYDCINGRWQMWEYFQDPCETIDPSDGGVIIVDSGKK